MNVIKLHDKNLKVDNESNLLLLKLKGKMTKQSIEEIENQLAEFRKE